MQRLLPLFKLDSFIRIPLEFMMSVLVKATLGLSLNSDIRTLPFNVTVLVSPLPSGLGGLRSGLGGLLLKVPLLTLQNSSAGLKSLLKILSPEHSETILMVLLQSGVSFLRISYLPVKLTSALPTNPSEPETVDEDELTLFPLDPHAAAKVVKQRIINIFFILISRSKPKYELEVPLVLLVIKHDEMNSGYFFTLKGKC